MYMYMIIHIYIYIYPQTYPCMKTHYPQKWMVRYSCSFKTKQTTCGCHPLKWRVPFPNVDEIVPTDVSRL